MKKNIFLTIVSLFILTGCVSKTVPKNMSELQQISSLDQFEGCYLSLPSNSHMGNNLARKLIKSSYPESKKAYKICLKSFDNKRLDVLSYNKEGKIIGRGNLEIGKNIESISDARLILHSDYGIPIPKGSDAGMMAAATIENTFVAIDVNKNLIYSNSWSGAGAALILFLPVPILHHNEDTYLYQRID